MSRRHTGMTFATQNASLYIGLGAAIDFLYHIGIENIVRRGNALTAYLQRELLQLGDTIEMLTPVEERSRGFITGFRLKNMPYEKFGEARGEKKFSDQTGWRKSFEFYSCFNSSVQ